MVTSVIPMRSVTDAFLLPPSGAVVNWQNEMEQMNKAVTAVKSFLYRMVLAFDFKYTVCKMREVANNDKWRV